MPFVQAGDVRLHYVEHGRGDRVVVFVHGNLGCVEWMNLVWPRLPDDLHVYAFDWRGCGLSDKPAPEPDYANYGMDRHAQDLLTALDALGIERCDLANHSTGGIICDHALLAQPDRFGRVLSLDPVAPRGLRFDEQGLALFQAMKADRAVAFAALATAAASLFEPESLAPGQTPTYRATTSAPQRALFELLVDKTRLLSDGIWQGTPVQLTREFERGELHRRQGRIRHPHLALWGELDYWIPRADLEEMARLKPNCELRVLPGVGHSMNLEDPAGYAALFADYFTNPR
jgi:non-heme chloroperoxidase